MVCKTPAALEMAIKAAAKASPLETGRAVSGFYFHRLLCRVFSKPDSPFMLKGGQSMLARTMDARATRDIDLLSERQTSTPRSPSSEPSQKPISAISWSSSS
mgnify:CR=1 FL=1